MATITIGQKISTYNTQLSNRYSILNMAGAAASGTGTINEAELSFGQSTTNVKYGTFTLVSGTTYYCNDYADLGDFTSGTHSITGLDIGVTENDRLGTVINGSYRAVSGVTGGRIYYLYDAFTGSNYNFNRTGDHNINTYGEGVTPGKKWNGITISKWNGIVVSKINSI